MGVWDWITENPVATTAGAIAGIGAGIGVTVLTGGLGAGLGLGLIAAATTTATSTATTAAATAAATAAVGNATAALVAHSLQSGIKARDIVIIAAVGRPTYKFGKSMYDNCIRDTLESLKPGAVVRCDLAHEFYHTGIYVGDNRIVHLNGDGQVQDTSPDNFLARMGGWNPAISIYSACRDGVSVGSDRVAQRALDRVGEYLKYGSVGNNCHRFTAECLTGSSQAGFTAFWQLRVEVRDRYDTNEWRVWDYPR